MKYLVAFSILIGVVSGSSEICKAPCKNGTCVFNIEVELTAGQLGKRKYNVILLGKTRYKRWLWLLLLLSRDWSILLLLYIYKYIYNSSLTFFDYCAGLKDTLLWKSVLIWRVQYSEWKLDKHTHSDKMLQRTIFIQWDLHTMPTVLTTIRRVRAWSCPLWNQFNLCQNLDLSCSHVL